MSGRPRARRWLFRWFLLGTSLAAGFSATATLDPVWGSGPATNRVWQLPPAPRLTWVGSGENLVKNGDFETGDFTGWDRVSPSGKQITLASAGNRVFSGTRSVAFITSFPGPQSLSQLVTLPPGSTPVLSWADRVVLSGENYQPPDHSFRVEVQTPEGFPLETLHELRPGDPRILPWTQRSVDLSRYAGQTVRISFVESDTSSLEVYLDEVRVETAAPIGVTYEVLLSEAVPPGPADRLGTTDQPSMPLPELLPNRPYFWQVLAHANGQTFPGSVWMFRTGTNGPASRMDWQVPPGDWQLGQPIPASLTTRDAAGFEAPAATNAVMLALAEPAGRPARLLISEVVPQQGSVEFLNATAEGLNLGNWTVALYDSTTWPAPRTTFVFPANTTVAAGKLITLRRGGGSPGSGSSFFTGQPLAWNFHNTNRIIAVLLQDAEGSPVDFFAADQAWPGEITAPRPIPLAEWIGRPAPRQAVSFDVYQRAGNRDFQTARDWVKGIDSLGRLNPYGGPLFGPGLAVVPLAPEILTDFGSGRWTGQVVPEAFGPGRLLVVDDRRGQVGWSGPRNISDAPAFTFEIPATLSEGAPSVQARLALPAATTSNVVFCLNSNWPGRLPVPTQVTIPAGATEATFAVGVAEDSGLQGDQAITLEASANGFARQSRVVQVRDNESNQLTLTAPADVREDGPGDVLRLAVERAAEAPVTIELTVTPPGQVALSSRVVLPAGRTSLTIPFSVINDGMIDGDQSISVTASSGNWNSGTTSVVARDNEDRQLRLTLPARIRGEITPNRTGRVYLSGTLPEPLLVRLTVDPADRLNVPATVVIPAGATHVDFPLSVAPFDPPASSAVVTVTASSETFLPATALGEVWDDRQIALTLAASDLVHHPGWNRLLVAVTERDVNHPNQVVVLDPRTGQIERSLEITGNPTGLPTNPTALALSDDGRVLWVGSYNDGAVRRVDLDTFTVTDTFFLDGYWPVQLIARRGRNDSVIVYRYLNLGGAQVGNEVALYTRGVRQPEVIARAHLWFINVVRGDGDQLFLITQNTLGDIRPVVSEFTVGDAGFTWRRSAPEDGLEDPYTAWAWADGRLYAANGQIRDTATWAALPGIPGLNHSALVVEPDRDQAFYLGPGAGDGNIYLVRANLATRSATEPLAFPFLDNQKGFTRPVRWGDSGIAFRSDDTLYLLSSAFVNPGPPANLVLLASAPPDLKVNGDFVWTLTVSNAGPAAATSVRLDGSLPPGLEFKRGEVPGGSASAVFNGWTASLPAIPAGQTATALLTLRPSLAGNLPLSVQASLLQHDAAPEDNTLNVALPIGLSLAADDVQWIDLAAADLCFDPASGALWATVPDPKMGGTRDRLVRLNLDTGFVEAEFPSGRLPGRLVRSEDGEFLYVALDGEASVQRFDLRSETWGPKLFRRDQPLPESPSRYVVTDMVVLPGQPERAVVVWQQPQFPGAPILPLFQAVAFEGGRRLPEEVAAGPDVELGTAADEVLTYSGPYGMTFSRHRFTDSGLQTTVTWPDVLDTSEMRVVDGRVYTGFGLVAELSNLTEVRRFAGASGSVLPLPAQKRVLFLNRYSAAGPMPVLQVNEIATGRLLQEISLPGLANDVGRPVHCGGDRVAFLGRANSSAPDRIVLVRTTAVPSVPAPADLQIHLAAAPSVVPFTQDVEFRISVTNRGPNVAERVRFALPWVGGVSGTNTTRGTLTHDFYGGLRGFVDQLAPGEHVEAIFRTRPSEAGRYSVSAWAYSASADPVPDNDAMTIPWVVAWPPALFQVTRLVLANEAIAAHPDGRRLFVSAPDGVLTVNTPAGEIDPVARFGPGPGALALTADGASLWVAFDRDHELRRYRLADGQLQQSVVLPRLEPVRQLVVHPSNPAAMAFAQENTAFGLLDNTVTPLAVMPFGQSLDALAFAPDGSVLLARRSYENFQFLPWLDRLGYGGSDFGKLLATRQLDRPTESLRVESDRVYLDDGAVHQPISLEPLPALSAFGSPCPRPSEGNVAYLQIVNAVVITVVDPTGVTPTKTQHAGGFLGTAVPSSLFAWGVDGLGLRTASEVVLFRLNEVSGREDRDFDGDGLSDAWERSNKFNPNLAIDGLADPDRDGVITRDEVAAGTDYLNPSSVLKLKTPTFRPGEIALRFEGVSGFHYQTETAAELTGDWQSIGDSVVGTGAIQEIVVPLPVSPEANWFRLRVTGP